MIISAHKVYVPLFIVVMLLQLYLPSFKINVFFQLFVLALFFFIERISFSVSFIKQVLPLIVLILIGFIGAILHRHALFNIIKDVIHFIKPLIGLLIGYLFFKKINNFRIFARTIVHASLISAFVHFIIIAFLVKFKVGSIHEIREFTKDNFLELIGLFFLVFYKWFYKEPILRSRTAWLLYTIIIFISVSLYFSRTMIVAGAILFISVFGYTKLTKRSMAVIATLLIMVGLLYAYLFSVNIRRDKPGLESFLYKVKNAPAEVFKANVDRDNHRELWDHWRGYEAKRALTLMEEHPSSFVFGVGHGSLVNLKFYAPLTGDKKGIRYISELHNGYMYVLYKTGIAGLLIYLFLLARWYVYIYRQRTLISVLISAISVIYFFSTLTITGIYNGKDIFIFILGAMFFFINQDSSRNSKVNGILKRSLK